MNRLRPLIAEAQGQLTPEEIQMKAVDAAQAGAPPSEPAPPVISPSQPLKHYHGRAHFILFLLLLADVPSTLIDVSFKSGWTDAFGLLLLLATAFVAILALVKHHHTDLPTKLKN